MGAFAVVHIVSSRDLSNLMLPKRKHIKEHKSNLSVICSREKAFSTI